MPARNPGHDAGRGFPSTRHSVFERLRSAGTEARQHAFGDLVEGYWKPVYTHVRLTWRLEPEDAQDATQGFFAEAFEKKWLERFEPARARFRTFVRVCADRYIQNRRQTSGRVKRGGSIVMVPLDFAGAEGAALARLAAPAADPDAVFHEEFIRALFERAVAAVREESEAAGRQAAFALFERYDLAPRQEDSYASLAAELGLSAAQVTNTLAQQRRRFREHALAALRALSGSDDEFRRDVRELFGLEVE